MAAWVRAMSAPLRVSLALAAWVTIGNVTRAQSSSSGDRVVVLRLYNGLNAIDLLGDGHRGQVVVNRRENFNAHGYSTAMFQLHAFTRPADTTSAVAWQVVPFFGPDHPAEGSELFRTTEGADCVLGDLRVFRRGRGRPVEIVLAYRAFGTSSADPATVRFEFYVLRTNDEGVTGVPAYYFQHVRTVRARNRYCDVNDAFAHELAMGDEGLR